MLPLVAACLVSAACIASILAVSSPGLSRGSNTLSAAANGQEVVRARALVLRQEGKLSQSAALYRSLWGKGDFVKDALPLAAVYSDMANFNGAAACYQAILEFDQRQSDNSHAIVRDLNNLAVCYRTWATCSKDEKVRMGYLKKARDYLLQARACGGEPICSHNLALVEADLSRHSLTLAQ